MRYLNIIMIIAMLTITLLYYTFIIETLVKYKIFQNN